MFSLALLGATFGPIVAPAAVPAPAPGAADVAVEGTVLERWSAWEGGFIVTHAKIQVERVMRGEVPAALEVTEIGGRVGDIAQVVRGRPAMPPGPRVALELRLLGSTWRIAGILEPGAAPSGGGGGLAAYVRSTNKDTKPPCDGPLKEAYWPTTTVHWL